MSRSRSADFEFERLIPGLLCGDKVLSAMTLTHGAERVLKRIFEIR